MFIANATSWMSGRLKNRYGVQQLGNDVRYVLPFDFSLGSDDQPMAQHAQSYGLDVFVGEIVPAVEKCPRPGAAEEAEAGTGTGA